MKRQSSCIHSIVLAVFFSALLAQAQTPNHGQLEITYIANDGFLIAYESKKILIDALHTWPNYQSTPDDVFNDMRAAKPPFEDIDIVLVTHPHPDHFHPDMIELFLANHTHTKLIAPPVAIELLKITAPERFETFVENQIIMVDIDVGGVFDLSEKGIDLKIFGLDHGGPSDMLNFGFLIKMDDKTLLHEGDSNISHAYFQSAFCDTDSIDILFENDPYRTDPERQKIIQDYLKPKHRIGMHIQPKNLERFVREIKATFPDEIIFTEPMEKRVFK